MKENKKRGVWGKNYNRNQLKWPIIGLYNKHLPVALFWWTQVWMFLSDWGNNPLKYEIKTRRLHIFSIKPPCALKLPVSGFIPRVGAATERAVPRPCWLIYLLLEEGWMLLLLNIHQTSSPPPAASPSSQQVRARTHDRSRFWATPVPCSPEQRGELHWFTWATVRFFCYFYI